MMLIYLGNLRQVIYLRLKYPDILSPSYFSSFIFSSCSIHSPCYTSVIPVESHSRVGVVCRPICIVQGIPVDRINAVRVDEYAILRRNDSRIYFKKEYYCMNLVVTLKNCMNCSRYSQ